MVKHVMLVEALDVREIILTLTVFLLNNFGIIGNHGTWIF